MISSGGNDYNPRQFTVKFDAGMIRVPFDISIDRDDVLEGNETFSLTIDPSSLPSKVTVTNPNQTTVIIVDDDGKKTIIFSMDQYKNTVWLLDILVTGKTTF